jgi:hypothetical protein
MRIINILHNRRIINGLPLFVLSLILGFSIILALHNNWYFTSKIIAGIISFIVSILLYIIRFKWYYHVFLIVLFLGCFDVLHFTFTNYTISFYIEFIKQINLNSFNIQLLSTAILLFVIALNLKIIVKRIMIFLRE